MVLAMVVNLVVSRGRLREFLAALPG